MIMGVFRDTQKSRMKSIISGICVILAIHMSVIIASAEEFCNVAGLCYERTDEIHKYSLVWLKTLISGEDTINNLLRVEHRYINIPIGGTTSRIAADQLYKTGSGYVKNISCFSDAVATAGTIVLYDNIVSGTGNILWSFDVQVIGYPTPFVVPLEVPFSIGLFLDFTTTTDMFCTVSYR